jgi:hypothetical protein
MRPKDIGAAVERFLQSQSKPVPQPDLRATATIEHASGVASKHLTAQPFTASSRLASPRLTCIIADIKIKAFKALP